MLAGLGLFALEPIMKDSLIGYYVGEHVPDCKDEEEILKRSFYEDFGAPSYVFNLRKN